jgi:hypothetical protein
MIESGNLFADIPEVLEKEQFLDLFSAPGVKIERIVDRPRYPGVGMARPGLDRVRRASRRGGGHPDRRRTERSDARARRLVADPEAYAPPGRMDRFDRRDYLAGDPRRCLELARGQPPRLSVASTLAMPPAPLGLITTLCVRPLDLYETEAVNPEPWTEPSNAPPSI